MQTLEEIFLNQHKVYLTACLPAFSLLQSAPTEDKIHALRWKQTLSLSMANGERDLPRQLAPPNLWLP